MPRQSGSKNKEGHGAGGARVGAGRKQKSSPAGLPDRMVETGDNQPIHVQPSRI